VRGIDYYELLGVTRQASQPEIRSAYRALAKALHPDAGGTAGAFRLLREAYETLADPVRRASYDRGGYDGYDEPDPDDDHADDPDDHPGGHRPEPETADRRRRSTGAGPRARRFGADPDFVPTLPHIDADDIPWWHEVGAGRPAAQHPPLAPSVPIVLATAGAAMLILLVLAVLTPPAAVWALVVAGIVAAGVDITRRFLSARRTDREFTAEFGGKVVFGRPGTEPDEIAERLTARLLAEHLTRIPGVRVFHGLAAEAGSVFADVDHAVLCGRRLVLVESKLWLPGHYDVPESGEVLRNGHRFRGGTVRLPALISAYRALLPELDIRGALLVYPNRAGEVTAGGALGHTPESFVAGVGGWLADQPSTVDRKMFRSLLEMVVSPG
jgi:hypothetical protein